MSEQSTGCPCEPCGKPIRRGHFVVLYGDIGEAHANCDEPAALPTAATLAEWHEGKTSVFKLVGDPMTLEPVEVMA